ncbi:ribonuclease domain-containing protein [Nocardia inohanensis]|uniref:ribonuclease domain-containing protein n=1 Tax=Nocardia inohanensis TaxID=209246 RepID=UPI000836E07D|nr:ribonuclease domain-containing protein [Nocardia inohanensis]
MKISPKLRAWLLLGVAVAMLLVAVLVSRGGDKDNAAPSNTKATATSTAPKPGTDAKSPAATAKPGGGAVASRAPGVPDKAYATLAEIDAGRWPDSAGAPGTKGGDTWMNRDRTLPTQDSAGKRITYQEWDVNPKKRGQDRDAERIVTGSDGTAWYTADHYRTFTRMR